MAEGNSYKSHSTTLGLESPKEAEERWEQEASLKAAWGFTSKENQYN